MNRKERRRAASQERHLTGAPPSLIRRDGLTRALLAEAEHHHNAGRMPQAIDLCRRVLSQNPDDAEGLLVLGSALSSLGQAEARAVLERSLELRPADARAWVVLSSHLVRAGDSDSALIACQRAIEYGPRFAAAYVTMGSILAAKRQFEKAEAAFRRALALQPGFVDAEINLGSALFRQGKLEEAAAAQRRALAQQPRHPHALRNLAAALRAAGAYEDALVAYRAATAAAPQFAEAHRDEALLLLLLGRFQEGWAKYEWRWRAEVIGAKPMDGPRWNGQMLTGETVLLQAEQGFGDTVQFLRYVPLVAQRGARVVVQLPRALMTLTGEAMQTAAQCVTPEDAKPSFDFHAPFLSLPRIFSTSLETLPAFVPYLQPPSGCAEKWRQKLSPFEGLRVGLVWAGNADHENDHNRSIAFTHLAPLLNHPNIRLFSLQTGARATDLTLAPGEAVIDLSGSLTDFGETAGVIEALDLTITVDTAVAHLAGALGKPVWLLLPHVPDWRWLLGRDDSPWYPTMRLFRQTRRGDWPEVIARVREQLLQIPQHNAVPLL